MVAGFAKQLATRYPRVLQADKVAFDNGVAKLGNVSVANINVSSTKTVIVVNMYTQDGYGRDSQQCDYRAIKQALKEVALSYRNKRIGMPLFSAGLAGGNWGTIAEIISDTLEGGYRVFAFKEEPTLGRGFHLNRYSNLYIDSQDKVYRTLLLKKLRTDDKARDELNELVKWDNSLARLKLSGGKEFSNKLPVIKELLRSVFYNRIIVAGGRDFIDKTVLTTVLDREIKKYRFVRFVIGMAKGADTLGYHYAIDNHIPCDVFNAQWDQILNKPTREIRINKAGKAYWVKAGFARNREMLNHADTLIAFWDGKSTGTKDMIMIAMKYLMVRVYNYNGERITL
jgi:hypothetical protein